MASSTGGGGNQAFSLSAPPMSDQEQPKSALPNYPYYPTPNSSYAPTAYQHSSTASSVSGTVTPSHGFSNHPYYHQQPNSNLFPPGTQLNVIRIFQIADVNQRGYLDEKELHQALSWNYPNFSPRTLRLIIFLFKFSPQSSFGIGPKEFTEVWNCIGQWRAIFETFDRDRSGRIDAMELRGALLSFGYALPPSVLQLLVSRYHDGCGHPTELNFDGFVEVGMIVKGLTEKFKEKDPHCTGSARMTFDAFMCAIIPFMVAE